MRCNYTDSEWVNKYNGLTYCSYYTEIEGNTFYLKSNCSTKELTKFQKKVLDRMSLTSYCSSILCSVPMVRIDEEILNGLLRAWNFDCKYKWLEES